MEDGRPYPSYSSPSTIGFLLLWLLRRLGRRRTLHSAKGARRSRCVIGTRGVLWLQRSCQLQRRLRRRCDQAAAIHGRIVDELPIVVVILVIELANGLRFARAGDTDNRSSAKNPAG